MNKSLSKRLPRTGWILVFLVAGIPLDGQQQTAASAFAQQVQTTAAIGEVQPVTFPAYQDIGRHAPPPVEYSRAVADRAFVMERVTYRSDDLEVYAYLYRPAAPPKGQRLPLSYSTAAATFARIFRPRCWCWATVWPARAFSSLHRCCEGAAALAGTTKWEGQTSTI